MKPIRGTLEECFVHLMHLLEKDSEHLRKRKFLADFAGVVVPTLQRWNSGHCTWKGEPEFRLTHYLEFLGYTVKEFESLPDNLRELGRLVAFKVISIEDAASMVGYEGDELTRANSLLRRLRGQRGLSQEKIEQIAAVTELYRSDLEVKCLNTERIVLFTTKRGSTPPEVPVTRSAALVNGSTVHRTAIIQSFARSVAALLPLAEDVVSDSFTAEDREEIRRLAEGGVSRLSRLLTQLSGEAARSALADTKDDGGTR